MAEPEDTASVNPTVSPHWVDPTATGDEDLDNVAGVYHYSEAAPPEGPPALAYSLASNLASSLTTNLAG